MKGLFKMVAGLFSSVNRKARIFALIVVGMLLSVQTFAAGELGIVTYDGTTGIVAFVPSVLVSPVITAVVATIGCIAVLFLIVIGCRWVFRIV